MGDMPEEEADFGGAKLRITQWDRSDFGQIAELFNQLEAEIPYSRPVDPESFCASIAEPAGDLHQEFLLVATEAGQPRGYVHAGLIIGDEDPRRGAIRSLSFPRDRRQIGQALLDSVHQKLGELGASKYQALTGKFGYRCTWYASLKSPWEHVYALLGGNGYRIEGQLGLVCIWPDYEISEPTLPDPGVEVEISDAPIYPNTTNHGEAPMVSVRAWRKGKSVGTCENRTYHLSCWGSAAQDVCYTGGMVVDERERGQGLGRYLMQRGLYEMRRHGHRHALLDLQGDNYAALMLYQSMGYRVAYTLCHMMS